MDSVEQRKARFLSTYGAFYGYNGQIDDIRAEDFSRLKGVAYLDHAGASLYSETQLQETMNDLSSHLLGNPLNREFRLNLPSDSHNASSTAAANRIEAARAMVLDLCNAPAGEYICIFTSGASAALKLVGECFPWRPGTRF
eukprot:gene27745-34255_t